MRFSILGLGQLLILIVYIKEIVQDYTLRSKRKQLEQTAKYS